MSKDIAVANYGMGNLFSVVNALRKIGASPRIVQRPEEVGTADGLILPGVGALRDCVSGLASSGLDDFIRGWIAELKPGPDFIRTKLFSTCTCNVGWRFSPVEQLA